MRLYSMDTSTTPEKTTYCARCVMLTIIMTVNLVVVDGVRY